MANNIKGMPRAAQPAQQADTSGSPGTAASTSGRPRLSTRDPVTAAVMPDRRLLHKAAASGDYMTLLHELCGAMSRVNETDPETGRTLLEAARDGGHHQAIALLINAGARVHPLAPNHVPAASSLYAAAEEGKPELLAAALASSKADLNRPDPLSGLTPLMFAIRGNHPASVEMLLRAGARPFHTGASGMPPLVQAAAMGHTEMLAMLFRYGADADQLDSLDRSALMAAARSGKPEAVEFLLTRDADIDRMDARGNTALSLAVNARAGKVIELLIAQAADVNPVNMDGRTPLMDAMQHGYAEGVALLLKGGAQSRLAPDDGNDLRNRTG
jgi:ankyrin repeat protein